MSLRSALQRTKSLSLATLLLTSQLMFAVAALPQTAIAANEISVDSHEGELSPAGSDNFSPGNITTYSEGEQITFRFKVTSSSLASGTMQVEFAERDNDCLFFIDSIILGSIVNISGTSPTVTKNGGVIAPTGNLSAGRDWIQKLDVSFSGSGSAFVYYTLTLSDEAGECGGSSTHTSLANSSPSGAFANIANRTVPIPAKDIIELPEIFVQKWVDRDGDGVAESKATAGEWSFSLDGAAAVPTDSNGEVVFTNVTPNGAHTITESNGPSGQIFLGGGDASTNCTFNGSTATATVTSGTTSTNATCVFNNGVAPGKIKIIKNAIPNNLTDFGFTSTGTGTSNFTLDDDSGVTGADNTYSSQKEFTGLTVGQYTFTESAVSGWDLEDISCTGQGAVTDKANRKVTINLSAGGDVTCTFENRQQGQVVVTKQTLPDGDSTVFPVKITGNNTIHSAATQNVTDGNSVTFTVSQGTFDVNETVPSGWSVDESDCQNLSVNGNTPLDINGIPTVSCTITNTKLATLNIIKDAIPNNAQNFEFSVTNLSGGNFLLDDDDDATLSNQKTFSNLTPGQSYSVTELSLGGWSLTGLSCDDQAVLGSTATVTPDPGESITCTFSNTKLVSVSGTKFEVDANATNGTGATGLQAWNIALYIDSNDNGVLDISEESSEQTRLSDSNGDYIFDDILYGTSIILREVLQAGWTQIFSPSPFNIDSVENVTDKDFGNFQNASISGFKWNDKNANDVVNEGEEKLSGWTITLKNSSNETVGTPQLTDQDGNYTFTNVAPGTYFVCETQQDGWIQTFPNDNMCHTVIINISGETETANFGNQGRGSISVIKNVDSDGDGNIDSQDVDNWTWYIDGTGDYATGSGNSQTVAAGDFTVSEDQKDNYHVTASSCTDEATPNSPSTSLDVSVSPGENVVCTFTNTRDTATVTVAKMLNPITDDGLFDLYVGGTLVKANASHNDSDSTTILTNQNYTVKELAGTETDLADYDSSYSCSTEQSGDGTSVVINASSNDAEITCTFTNVRRGDVSIVKDASPADGTDFDFAITKESPFEEPVELTLGLLKPTDISSLNDGEGSFTLDDAGDDDDEDAFGDTQELSLSPGTYYVSEKDLPDNWRLEDVSCSGIEVFPVTDAVLTLNVEAGAQIECTFSNEKDAQVVVTKFNDYNQDGNWDQETEPALPDWEMNLTGEQLCDEPQVIEQALAQFVEVGCTPYEYNSSLPTETDGSRTFTEVRPGVSHDLSETQQTDWTLSNIYCGEYSEENIDNDNSYEINSEMIKPGEQTDCFIGNYQEPLLLLEKFNNRPEPTVTGDTVTYTLVVSVPENSGTVLGVQVTDLPPENFDVLEGTETATQGNLATNYASPGQWDIGDMEPGDSVTLTYRTLIEDDVTPGEYPDIAFATGLSGNEETVYSNVNALANADDPFVGTDVSIITAAATFGVASVQLANTGSALLALQFLLPLISIGVVVAIDQRQKKGGRA